MDRQGCWELMWEGALSAPRLREARPVVVGLTADPPAPSTALGSQLVPSTHRSDGLMAACMFSPARPTDLVRAPYPARAEASRPWVYWHRWAQGVAGAGWREAPRLPSSQGDWQETWEFPGLLHTPPRSSQIHPLAAPILLGLSCVPRSLAALGHCRQSVGLLPPLPGPGPRLAGSWPLMVPLFLGSGAWGTACPGSPW